MATAASDPDHSTKVMEEGLTCYICYNFLREPKDLDCPHVYCLQCLQEWTKKKPIIECPECRHVTAVPQGGLVKLKTNFRLKTMVQDYVTSGNKRKAVPMCPNHEGERQHFFCLTCDITVCHNCLILDHPKPKHEIKDLQVIVQSLKEKMDHVKKEMESIQKQQEKLSEIERKLMEQHTFLVDQMGKLYSSKRSVGVHTKYEHHTSQAHTSQAEMSSLDSLQINPVSSQQKLPQLGHVDANSKGTCNLTLLSEFGTFRQVAGVAGTRTGQLAVVDYGSKEISINGKDHARYKHQYYLGSSKSNGNILLPCAVAVTLEGKFFISDNGVVKVFSPASRYERSWSESINATEITTTPDDMVVIGSHVQEVITVHQSNGELIRTHQVDCENLRGIASNGKQIAFIQVDLDKVCVIEFVTGETLWTCDLLFPGGICYEQKLNIIFVAGAGETGNDIIEQYCITTGRLISRLVGGLRYPSGMTVTQDNKLVVAGDKTVKIYQIDFE